MRFIHPFGATHSGRVIFYIDKSGKISKIAHILQDNHENK